MKDKEGLSAGKLTFHLEMSRTIVPRCFISLSLSSPTWNNFFSQNSKFHLLHFYPRRVFTLCVCVQCFYDRLFNLLAAKWIIIQEPQGRLGRSLKKDRARAQITIDRVNLFRVYRFTYMKNPLIIEIVPEITCFRFIHNSRLEIIGRQVKRNYY